MPLFRRAENTDAARRERQDQLDRRLAVALRELSHRLGKLAELVESRRLERSGYQRQDAFLERADRRDPP